MHNIAMLKFNIHEYLSRTDHDVGKEVVQLQVKAMFNMRPINMLEQYGTSTLQHNFIALLDIA